MTKPVSQYFDLLLNLTSDWQVIGVITNYKTSEIRIHIEHIGKKCECPDSFDLCSVYDHAPSREWRHLDTMDYKTYIVCKLPRITNKDGKIRTISPPWASKHDRHTLKFEHKVINLLLATKNQTKTASFMQCGFRTVNSIIHNSTKRGLARRNLSAIEFKNLSIDEKSFKKGHNYVSVLSSPYGANVIDVVEGRTKQSVRDLLDKSLTKEQQKNIRTISMDMWKAYMSVTKEKLPNASIVHDRFHLVKYLNTAIDKVRRREVKTNEELKNSRYALLKNKENLTEKQRIKFEAIKQANYEVSKAWQIRENFRDLFQKETNYIDAFYLFTKWMRDASLRHIKEVTKVVEMFKNHLPGVVNALILRFSNAMAERLNGKIQEIKTVGRGYRTFENFRSAILFFHGGLNLYPLNSQ